MLTGDLAKEHDTPAPQRGSFIQSNSKLQMSYQLSYTNTFANEPEEQMENNSPQNAGVTLNFNQ